jgi:hypothetical protein
VNTIFWNLFGSSSDTLYCRPAMLPSHINIGNTPARVTPQQNYVQSVVDLTDDKATATPDYCTIQLEVTALELTISITRNDSDLLVSGQIIKDVRTINFVASIGSATALLIILQLHSTGAFRNVERNHVDCCNSENGRK